MARPYIFLSEMRSYISAVTTGGAHVTNLRGDTHVLVRVDSMPMDAFKALMLLLGISSKDTDGLLSDEHIWLFIADLIENTRTWMVQNNPTIFDEWTS